MKPQETKLEFIKLRAEGRSFGYISEKLGISKSTCNAWESDLKTAISELKQEQLNELYTAFFMTKEARIKKLGETLNKINNTLEAVDFNEIAPEKLLDFKLKYTEALKNEYAGNGITPTPLKEGIDARNILESLENLLERIRAGEVSVEQASKESVVLANILKAYDTIEVKSKLDALEAAIGSR